MKIEERNWKEIQEYYDNNNSCRDTINNFKISWALLYKAVKLNYIELRDKSEAIKLCRKKYPIKHTNESRKKISEARIKYLTNNPDKVPYLLNHSRKESYPEKYFTELFIKENINVTRKLQVSYYELDFCIPDKKINIEIDGDQHYLDNKAINNDIKRNKFLEEKGWDIIRIKWSDYQKMNYEEKVIYITELKNYINKLVNTKPTIFFIKNDSKHNLCNCGTLKEKRANLCKKCYDLKQRRTIRPCIEILTKEVKEIGYSAVGRKYKVTGATIKKWINKDTSPKNEVS